MGEGKSKQCINCDVLSHILFCDKIFCLILLVLKFSFTLTILHRAQEILINGLKCLIKVLYF